MSAWETVVALVGLAAITVLTRGFFLLPEREVPIPEWLREALRHAPLAALVAVVVPETVMTQGHLIHDWRDARLFAAAAGALWFWWRRGILGTIVCGTVVLLALRLTLGW
ncbi:MAG TPA: AzlD domain-containing protein [Ideonella sp.]|uniref:AzlD domain-containing protein n=1 Tax=Ideonella sp. TaxID=1929293 RepID=UPI002CFF38A1|nr:AzlD domain-containing protein [Ideonella sp.]HSI50091.1 AzlD domain-containing protein [Ideonella sp.]